MKDVLIQFGLTFVLAYLVQLFLPWWSLIVVAGVVALFFQYKYAVTSFFVGLLAVALGWFLLAFFVTNTPENQVLVGRMGELFGGFSRMNLIITSATIGGIMGGLGALTGTLGRKLF
ncbi:MAG: hypothetical protein AAF847_04485 [Bacteroidota bacterium]